METFSSSSHFGVKFSPGEVQKRSYSNPSDQVKMQNDILFEAFQDVDRIHAFEKNTSLERVLIGVVFYKSGTNSFISVPEVYAGYMVMELVACDEVKRIHVGADKIAKQQGL